MKQEKTDRDEKEKLLAYLNRFITEHKLKKFDEVIRNRTRYLTVVLEDIFQPHNASAVLRTCDVFGIQEVHIIENRNRYEVNPDVALGSSKWLTLLKYHGEENNTVTCLDRLKSQGYAIIATSPHKDDYTPENLPLDKKIALVFGTELEGLSPAALGKADGFVRIPMVGFTESLNISVSAALLIAALSGRLRQSGIDWHLTAEEELDIRLGWARHTIRKSDLIEKAYREKRNG
ncbi:MAG TPA: RNA methyltransferase [Bacteroidales bacterium]|nr:RNA methyltransferase [Bacteroidales bacterium]